MSLIVARKEAESILVVSDTHLSYPDVKAVAVRQTRPASSGVIKTVIINNNISVSFAGGELAADNAFRCIEPDASLIAIKDILLKSHLDCHKETDFIITLGGPVPQLFEIKDSSCQEVEAAWIGSKKAFSAFQAFMQGEVKNPKNNIIQMETVSTGMQTKLFGTMVEAMDYVIENEDIPEVDGFRVSTVFTEGRFIYTSYVHSYVSNRPQRFEVDVPEGVSSFSFVFSPFTHGTAEDGGYLINFFESPNPEYAGIHISQGNFGIIYKRKEGGLMRPEIVLNMDEVDFIDYAEENFGIRPSYTIQNRGNKCMLAGNELYEKLDFKGALLWYNKALRRCHGKERALFYLRKALAHTNLKQYQDAILSLSEAVKSDSSCQKDAFLIVDEMRKRGARF